jgi:hypothetical protein
MNNAHHCALGTALTASRFRQRRRVTPVQRTVSILNTDNPEFFIASQRNMADVSAMHACWWGPAHPSVPCDDDVASSHGVVDRQRCRLAGRVKTHRSLSSQANVDSSPVVSRHCAVARHEGRFITAQWQSHG